MSYKFTGGYKIRDQGGLHFVTFTVEGWIDLFSRRLYRDIFLENLSYCRANKALQVGAYVIMSNHNSPDIAIRHREIERYYPGFKIV